MLFYGFRVDSLNISKGKVKKNQNLSEILTNFNVSNKDIYTLSQASKPIYDVRKLKAGTTYSIIYERDSLQTGRQFIFEPNPTEYVVYHLLDSIYAERHQKTIERNERTLAVKINSSLYETLIEQGTSPLLVNELVDIFAWQVDFFRIAKGDGLKVIFEEILVNHKVVGIGKIKAACFHHWGKKYYAIPFESEEEVHYFDETGKSLRKPFLKAPLNYSRISSRYSLRRFHPVQKKYKAHLGTDYAAPKGTPIRTVGDGTVLEARYRRGNGNYVKIRHNSEYTTQYLHMSKIAKGIRPGVKVRQGKTIGYVGSTGLASGPHLCFRFWKNGRQIDALKVNMPASKKLDHKQLPSFLITADSIKSTLDPIPLYESKPLFATIKYPLPTVD